MYEPVASHGSTVQTNCCPKEEEEDSSDDCTSDEEEDRTAKPASVSRCCGSMPTIVEALRDKRITAVDAGCSQSLAVGEEGERGCSVFGWGSEWVPGVQSSRLPTQHTCGSDAFLVCGPGYAPMPPAPWWPGWKEP